MDEKDYCDKWYVSSEFFYDNKAYEWMANQLVGYKTILEIGCGCGFSTLSLLNQGHHVISIEKNLECIKKADKLLKQEGFNGKYELVHVDLISLDDLIGYLKLKKIDAVACWNPGIGHVEKKLFVNYCKRMIKYGLKIEQIKENPESSYAEWMVYTSANIAKILNCPFGLVDRTEEDYLNIPSDYYLALKKELGFKKIESCSKRIESISSKGVVLVNNGKPIYEEKVELYMTSIIFSFS